MDPLCQPGCRGAALLPQKGARKIPRESDWSRSVDFVGRHPQRTCRLALRTKDPGGPGSNCGSAARDGRSRSRPCRREGSGWVQDPCRLGPRAPAPGWHVTQRCGRREDLKMMVVSPPLQPRPSESRQVPRLSDLTHLPPFGAQLASQEGPRPTSRRVYCFSAKLTGSQTCRY